MLKVSESGLRFIKACEGFSSHPYICPAGVWTIGYGSIRGVTKDSLPMTEAQASDLLLIELQRYEAAVSRLVSVPLNQHEFDALVSFTYNLGSAALQRSTLRQKLNRDDREGAAGQFIKWVWAGGRKLKGLVSRRIAERDMFIAPSSSANHP